MSYEEYAPWLPKGERAMSDEQPWEAKFIAERSRALAEEARADAAEMRLRVAGACEVCWTVAWAPCPEGTPRAIRDDRIEDGWMVCQMCERDLVIRAAEAQRDRLAVVVEGAMRALGAAHIVACDEPEWPTPCTPENCQVTAAVEDARAALADAPRHEGGHSVPAAESTADTDTLPDSTNATIMPGEGSSYADSTLSGKPIMPTLTDEEHAAVDRTLGRTHEARQARKRDEAYRAMVEALDGLDRLLGFSTPEPGSYTMETSVFYAASHAASRALALARQVEEG